LYFLTFSSGAIADHLTLGIEAQKTDTSISADLAFEFQQCIPEPQQCENAFDRDNDRQVEDDSQARQQK
jgi:hypothetical protein